MLLGKTSDAVHAAAVLQKLAADSNPQLAQLAQIEIGFRKKVAELMTKPFDLKFTAVDGSQVDLAKLRGKVVLIDFWATWCPPCVAEVPQVVAAYQKYHGQGFEIVGVSLDQDKDSLLAFTKRNGMTWPQYFDGGRFEDNAISKSFDIYAIPVMWLIDKNGMLVNTDPGDDLAGQVEKLLNEIAH